MNSDLRKNAKTDFKTYFCKLMNNLVFWKAIENVRRKNRNIKLVITEVRKNKPKLLYNKFSDNLLAMELKKMKKKQKTKNKNKQIFFNKPVYIGLSILEINKIVIFQF